MSATTPQSLRDPGPRMETGAATLHISLSGGRITARHTDGDGPILLEGGCPYGFWGRLVVLLVTATVDPQGPMVEGRRAKEEQA